MGAIGSGPGLDGPDPVGSPAVAEVERRLAEISALSSLSALGHWDQEVCMPEGGVDARSRALAALAGVVHERIADPRLGDLIEQAEAQVGEDPWRRANLREARRLHRRAAHVPPALAAEIASLTVRAQAAWTEARRESAFARFAPLLGELVGRVRERCAAIDPARPAYDVAIEEFEPGMTAARLDPLLAELRALLAPLAARVSDAAGPPPAFLTRPVPVAAQEKVSRALLPLLGFDLRRGRLDVAVHPSTNPIDAADVRLTTRYREALFLSSLYATIHEAGHGLYELGRPAAWVGQPVGADRGMGIHEAQSLLWEKQVGRSRAFLRFCEPMLREHAAAALAGVSLDDLLRGANHVERSFIRVDADEATYPLHICLRFDLERRLLSGELAVADLPGAWNDGFFALFGLRPPDDAQGCLQDVHWSMGAFGYFPSYALGTLYAAQMFEAAAAAIGDLPALIARGEFAPLLAWLRERIHSRGCLLETDALCLEATGAPLSLAPFRRYLEGKYREIGWL